MPLASLMVHVDLDHPDDSRLRIARDLAARFGASLIGITACGAPTGASAPGSFGVAMALVDRDRKQGEEHLNEAEQGFRAAMTGLDAPVEWRAATASPATYLAQQARSADLIIVGAGRERLIKPSVHTLDVTELMLCAGRPLLLVPPEVDALEGARIVVAWKDAREARRAVRDALPLLQRAEAAFVVEVAEDRASDQTPSGGADVAVWLRRHGVAAQSMIVEGMGRVAAHLDRVAAEQGADLVVAGAYGHGRFREWVLGGVTRDLLLHTKRCVLLAH